MTYWEKWRIEGALVRSINIFQETCNRVRINSYVVSTQMRNVLFALTSSYRVRWTNYFLCCLYWLSGNSFKKIIKRNGPRNILRHFPLLTWEYFDWELLTKAFFLQMFLIQSNILFFSKNNVRNLLSIIARAVRCVNATEVRKHRLEKLSTFVCKWKARKWTRESIKFTLSIET